MNVVFFGTGTFGLPVLNAILRSPFRLTRVVTTPDKPRGRGANPVATPVKEWARSNGVPISDFPRLDDPKVTQALADEHADFFVVVSYGFVLPQTLLDLPSAAPINVHASLLPRYRGPAPIHWALLNGDEETGVTVMRMHAKLDGGDIAAQRKAPIDAQDDFETLESRLAALGAEALLEALDGFRRRCVTLTPQEEAHATYARKITKEDGPVHWAKPAKEVRNQIRALVRWPKAHGFYDRKRILFLGAAPAPVPLNAPHAPGQIVEASERRGLVIACLDAAIRITRLQLEGRKPLPVEDFLRGFPMRAGALLE